MGAAAQAARGSYVKHPQQRKDAFIKFRAQHLTRNLEQAVKAFSEQEKITLSKATAFGWINRDNLARGKTPSTARPNRPRDDFMRFYQIHQDGKKEDTEIVARFNETSEKTVKLPTARHWIARHHVLAGTSWGAASKECGCLSAITHR